MQIDKNQILELLRSKGQAAQADRAQSELPDQVDTDQHAGLLERLGIDVGDILRSLGGDAGNLRGKFGL